MDNLCHALIGMAMSRAGLNRRTALATSTLRYGRAEERAPQRTRLTLSALADEAAASALPEGGGVTFENRVPRNLQVDADSEHLFRTILVPHDFSRHASRALRMAAALAGPEGRLIALHVVAEAQRGKIGRASCRERV